MAIQPLTANPIARLLNRIAGTQRIVHSEGGRFHFFGEDLLGQQRGTAKNRRTNRGNHDIAAFNAVVFGAIRWREQAIVRPGIVLEQRIGREWEPIGRLGEPGIHPALDALRNVSSGMGGRHGIMGIERGKLTNGSHVWIKVRANNAAGGQVVGFISWDTSRVRIFPNKERWWELSRVERSNENGSTTSVDAEDVVLFRHILDGLQPLWGLTPIGAVRMETDTAFEAMRHNMRYFDNGLPVGQVLVPDGSEDQIDPVEIQRMIQQMRDEWQGTDNAHTWHILERNLKPLMTPQTMVDLQFTEMLLWTVEQVARAFELSPITLKDFRRATYSNADEAAAQDWTTIANQLSNTLEELNDWFIWPDYGTDLRLVGDFTDIPALQPDAKARAETDKIEVDMGKVSTNELRARDGMELLDGGDIILPGQRVEAVGALVRAGYDPIEALAAFGMPAITHIGLPPVTVQAQTQEQRKATDEAAIQQASQAPERLLIPAAFEDVPRIVEGTPSTDDEPGLLAEERTVAVAWRRRFSIELRRILGAIDAQDTTAEQRSVDDINIESMNWDWADRYLEDVARELTEVHITVLSGEAFLETPLLSAHDLAVSYANSRAGELLSVNGPQSVVRTTRNAMRQLVAKAVEDNWTVRQLKNAVRDSFEFGVSRSESIARTEIAFSQGRGARDAARTQGRDEKRWFTARDERVDGGDASGPCIDAARDGWISIDDSFSNGRSTVPAHPRCRCDVEYRSSALQVTP